MAVIDTVKSDSMSIAKGIAIIAMVIGHAEVPGLITTFIYTWHMPLFFIAAGYFFSEKALANPWEFVEKRFKKLYLPFLKWSLLFLLLHNVWFYFGILNEQYGNWNGGTTHPYTLQTAMQRVVLIFTSMSGYDEFMAGAFWFFRGLLVASIMFMLIYRLMCRKTRIHRDVSILLICAGCVAFVALRLLFHIKLTFYPNGGWRETWGIFFFGVGVLYRRYEDMIPKNWFVILAGFALMLVAGHFHLCGMNNSAQYRDLWTLPLTGTIGFITVHQFSQRLAEGLAGGALSKGLVYVGQNTMPVFVFHIIAYKLVSLVKIWWYGLDFGQIGCHMVIHHNSGDLFWVLYTIVGVGVPLWVDWMVKRFKSEGPSAVSKLLRISN